MIKKSLFCFVIFAKLPTFASLKKQDMMKRLLLCLLIVITALPETYAVLKERDLDQTLEVLRAELRE